MDTKIDKIVEMCNGSFMVFVRQGAVRHSVNLCSGTGVNNNIDGYGLCHCDRGSVGVDEVCDYVIAKATPVVMDKHGVFTVKAFNSEGKPVTLKCTTWTELLPSYITGE